MGKSSLVRPKNPERICWGCDRYCPANDLVCGNGTIRTPHPIELLGEDWLEQEQERYKTIDSNKCSSAATGSSVRPVCTDDV
jgi:hypothetical protein